MDSACADSPLCMPGEKRVCYTGALATLGVGTCKAGLETCNALGTAWGTCENEVIPLAIDACNTLTDENCDGQVNDGCAYSSCKNIHVMLPDAPSGLYEIDPDGPGGGSLFDVYCDMALDGGGWTLVVVASDDGQNTWTWNNRNLMTTNTMLVGNVVERNKDFKSRALHVVPFSDLLFVHAPSTVWAAYAGVGNGALDLANFMAGIPYPVCDLALAGNGYPMTAGTMIKAERLCDTGLYFHLGDFDGTGDPSYCAAGDSYQNSSFGPCWNMGDNDGCPFDDSGYASLGPSRYVPAQDIESIGAGFGHALGLNKGVAAQAQNYVQMYVR